MLDFKEKTSKFFNVILFLILFFGDISNKTKTTYNDDSKTENNALFVRFFNFNEIMLMWKQNIYKMHFLLKINIAIVLRASFLTFFWLNHNDVKTKHWWNLAYNDGHQKMTLFFQFFSLDFVLRWGSSFFQLCHTLQK